MSGPDPVPQIQVMVGTNSSYLIPSGATTNGIVSRELSPSPKYQLSTSPLNHSPSQVWHASSCPFIHILAPYLFVQNTTKQFLDKWAGCNLKLLTSFHQITKRLNFLKIFFSQRKPYFTILSRFKMLPVGLWPNCIYCPNAAIFLDLDTINILCLMFLKILGKK